MYPEDVLDALSAWSLVKDSAVGSYMTLDEAKEEYIMLSCDSAYGSVKEQEEEARTLIQHGEQYYNEGYRLHKTSKRPRGCEHIVRSEVPANALVYRLVEAGHIATSLQVRAEYVTKK